MPKAPTFVVTARVKEFNSTNDFRSDGELVDAVNVKVQEMLSEAQHRAESNGRRTVRPQDL